jgi:beta-galactosidase
MNFTDEKQALPASLAGMVDLITGKVAKEGDVMNKWDVKILQEAL